MATLVERKFKTLNYCPLLSYKLWLNILNHSESFSFEYQAAVLRQYLEPACAMFPTEEFCSCYWENSEFSYDWFIESIVYANGNQSCKVSVLNDYSDNWCSLNPLLKFFKSNEISSAGLSVFCQNELACICHLFENYKNCLWGWMIWSFHWGVSLPGWGWGILTQGGVGNTGWGKFL